MKALIFGFIFLGLLGSPVMADEDPVVTSGTTTGERAEDPNSDPEPSDKSSREWREWNKREKKRVADAKKQQIVDDQNFSILKEWEKRQKELERITNEEVGDASKAYQVAIDPTINHRARLKQAALARRKALDVLYKYKPGMVAGKEKEYFDDVAKDLIAVIQDRKTLETLGVAMASLAAVRCDHGDKDPDAQSLSHELFISSNAMYIALLYKRRSDYLQSIKNVVEEKDESIKKEVNTTAAFEINMAMKKLSLDFGNNIIAAREYYVELVTWTHLWANSERLEKNHRVKSSKDGKRRNWSHYVDSGKTVRRHYSAYKHDREKLKHARAFTGLSCATDVVASTDPNSNAN